MVILNEYSVNKEYKFSKQIYARVIKSSRSLLNWKGRKNMNVNFE